MTIYIYILFLLYCFSHLRIVLSESDCVVLSCQELSAFIILFFTFACCLIFQNYSQTKNMLENCYNFYSHHFDFATIFRLYLFHLVSYIFFINIIFITFFQNNLNTHIRENFYFFIAFRKK